jgi:hypothetical protein
VLIKGRSKGRTFAAAFLFRWELILGALTGIAAFFGAFMNWNYIVRNNNIGVRFVGAYVAAAQLKGWIMTREQIIAYGFDEVILLLTRFT